MTNFQAEGEMSPDKESRYGRYNLNGCALIFL